MTKRLLTLAAGFAMTVSATAMSHAADLQLYHSWSNESELAALNVFVSELESRGHKVSEMSAPHEQAGSSPLNSLIIAGTPPNIFLSGQAEIFRDLRDMGIGQDMGPFFDEIGASENFPAIVREAIKVDGETRKIPSGIHIDGIIY